MVLKSQLRHFEIDETSSSLLRRWQSGFASTRARIGLAVFLFVLCLIPVLAGPVVQYEYAHDAFIFLDGGWRILHGQRPQVDFSTNLGPVVFLFTAAGIAIAKHGGYALVLAQTFMGALIAALAYWISTRRLSVIAGTAVSGAAVLLALAPYNTGAAPFNLTFGMMYNRFGYALVGLLLVEAARGPRPGSATEREELMGGMFTGFIGTFLFFLKITYALVAFALILALLPYRAQNRRRFSGMAIAALAFTVLTLAYLRFDIPALVREFALAAGGKHMARIGPFEIGIANVEPTITLVVLGALAAILFAAVKPASYLVTRPWAILVTAILGFGLLITNHQGAGLPLNAFMCILVASEVVPFSRRDWIGPVPLNAASLLIVIGLCAPLIGLVLPTLVAYTLPVISPLVEWQTFGPEMRLDAPAVSDFRSKDLTARFGRQDEATPGNYVEFVDDGLDLLRKYSSPNETVTSLEFSNPFSFSLQRQPPHGGTTCLQFGVTFDNDHKLTPDQVFGDADLVMLPNAFSAPMLGDAVERMYVPALLSKFREVAESSQWTLFRRIR